MTTIFPPSESVRRFLYKDDWCIVVVADLNKPEVFESLFLFTLLLTQGARLPVLGPFLAGGAFGSNT